MVNMLAAILISAVVGFMAGHFLTAGNDPEPASMKEAVTGDPDPPPKPLPPPRLPPPAPPKSEPVMCQQGKTLQQQMTELKFFEMQSICREAARDWQKRNIDDYAPIPDYGTNEDRQAQRELLDMVRDPIQTATYWKGQASIVHEDRSIQIEIFANFFASNDPDPNQQKRASLSIDDPEKLCHGLSPMFVINGKGMPTGSVSGCGSSLRKKGESFYFSWETFNDEMLSPAISALLIPVPGARANALEYLDSQTGQWVKEPRFHWSPSTYTELEEARDRHMKKVDPN